MMGSSQYAQLWMPDGLCFSVAILWVARFVATFTENENINEAERLRRALSLSVCTMANI